MPCGPKGSTTGPGSLTGRPDPLIGASHDVGDLTHRDVALAAEISALAREIGVPAAPERVTALELALDVSGDTEQRWHLDVWVPEDQVATRIAAFIAAGGRLVDDSNAPSFWVLADAEGNRSCVCAVTARD